jgi:ABC-2 type transport system permease protein
MNSREITSKDLLLLCRDRRTLSVLVALPLAFISILGFSTGQLFSQADKSHAVKVGIVDADATELSENIVQKLRGMSALTVSDYPDRSAARAALAEDKIHVLLYIGPKYHEKVADVTLYDLFHVERGNLRGKLKVLDMAVESGSFLANSSQIVQELVFAFSLQTMAPSVLDKDPKLKLQIARASRRSDGETETETEEPTPATTPPPGLSIRSCIRRSFPPTR